MTLSTPAIADKSAIATELFDRGIALMEQGKFPRACRYLEASYRQEPLLGALLALADCEYERKRLNAALGRYQEYVNRHENLADAARNKQGTRLAEAKSRIVELKRLIPSIIATIPSKVKVPIVYLDGVRIRPGEKYPVDPGAHEIALDAHGYETGIARIEARPGQTLEVPVKTGRFIPSSRPVRDDSFDNVASDVDNSNDQVQRAIGVTIGTVVLVGIVITSLVAASTLDQNGSFSKGFNQFKSPQSARSFSMGPSAPYLPLRSGFISAGSRGEIATPALGQPLVLPMVQVGQTPELPVIFGIQGLF